LDNILCGRCNTSAGYSEFGSLCIKCDHPQGAMIFVVILCIFALVFILHLVAQTESGLPAIFFYFGNFSFFLAHSFLPCFVK
jgi:hypothetical protein